MMRWLRLVALVGLVGVLYVLALTQLYATARHENEVGKRQLAQCRSDSQRAMGELQELRERLPPSPQDDLDLPERVRAAMVRATANATVAEQAAPPVPAAPRAAKEFPPPEFSHVCASALVRGLPMCDARRSADERAADAVQRMEPAELVGLLATTSLPVDRLAIPATQWWCETLHGIRCARGVHCGNTSTTQFPQVISLAASFNRTLWFQVASAVGTELRAFAHANRSCLATFTPNVNIVRDPRWGRGQETPGEDPLVASAYADAFVRGLQQPRRHVPANGQGGSGEQLLKVAATCKHFLGYDLERLHGMSRHRFDAAITAQDLWETYLPPFEACVKAQAALVMCSYNKVNGVPACANPQLNNALLRERLGFGGVVVSDCRAIRHLYETQGFVEDLEQAAAVALMGGVDLDCGMTYNRYAEFALSTSSVDPSVVVAAARRVLAIRFRLGEFDNRNAHPHGAIDMHDVDTKAHRVLARQAALESVVLLKNEGPRLPLDAAATRSVAVIGPHANATVAMQGNYFGNPPFFVPPVRGFARLVEHVVTVEGCNGPADATCNDDAYLERCVEAVEEADAVVIVAGLDQNFESERTDRYEIGLPGRQNELIARVAFASKHARGGIRDGALLHRDIPVVVVVMSGSSVDLGRAKHDSTVDAIIWCGYPGQSGGRAVADVVFGLASPSARLPVTFYPSWFVDRADDFDMRMRPHAASPGRGYRFFAPISDAPYVFGDGLGYAAMAYSWDSVGCPAAVRVSAHSPPQERGTVVAECTLVVRNEGDRPSAHVVLAYLSNPAPTAPRRALVAFDKVWLESGATTSVGLGLTWNDLGLYGPDGNKAVASGRFVVSVGNEGFDNVLVWEMNVTTE